MKTICVYCGSSPGSKSDYITAAKLLASEIVNAGAGLVYGGASIGVMGAIADGVMEAGGEVTGVIPKALEALEISHQGLTELIVVADMHERKAKMAALSDGFIAMPGGLGTLEELFEMLTWSQLSFHEKPVAVLNTGGFYDQLIAFLEHQSNEGFIKPVHRDLLLAEADPRQLLSVMKNYQPPSEFKL